MSHDHIVARVVLLWLPKQTFKGHGPEENTLANRSSKICLQIYLDEILCFTNSCARSSHLPKKREREIYICYFSRKADEAINNGYPLFF